MVGWLKFCSWTFQRQMILARAARAAVKTVRGRVTVFIEAMEQRRLLTSSCSYDSGQQLLDYQGDSNANTITASTTSGTLTVTDGTTACPQAQNTITFLTISGGDGNDTITVGTS